MPIWTNDPRNKLPAGTPTIFRSVIVRLGPEFGMYYPSNHGTMGIDTVEVETRNDGTEAIRVYGPWDFDREVILDMRLSIDFQLGRKGVNGGPSGGSSRTSFSLQSYRALTSATGTVIPAGTPLRPRSSVFDSGADNVQLSFVSALRPQA